jgi:glycine betaine/choline ABC-type transport system substrate-binding protein
MTDFTIGDMIAKHRELKVMVEAAQEAFDAEWKPYRDAMTALQTACGAELQRQNLQNFKSDDGTAYLKHGDSVTVNNREDFVKFVLDGHLDFLDARVLKDPVRAWTDEHSAPPPGVKIEPFVTCIIRK